MKDMVRIMLIYIKSREALYKLKARDFNATSLSTYEFSTLSTTLPHNLIKDKCNDVVKKTFKRKCVSYLACNDRNAFKFRSAKIYHAWSCQNVCDVLTFCLYNIFLKNLKRSCQDKLKGFQWALIVLPWLQIYSRFVMRGTLWRLFLMISMLTLLTLFTLHPNILIIFRT